MKRQSILLSLSFLAISLFFSCTQKTIKTDNKEFKKKFYLAKDTTKGALSVDLDIEIPIAFADSLVLKSVRNVVITNLFGEDYISHPNDSIVQLFSKNIFTEYKENNEPLDRKSVV